MILSCPFRIDKYGSLADLSVMRGQVFYFSDFFLSTGQKVDSGSEIPLRQAQGTVPGISARNDSVPVFRHPKFFVLYTANFYKTHPTAKSPLLQWFQEIKKGEFRNIEEIRSLYPHADKVGRRTVFNIGGNKYRLITRINYLSQKIIISVLTHAEYDKNQWK